ncbi:sigma-54-dependent Fis family transcriptional regulator [Pseudoflavitalea sp. G-6-1-2]|uniref:sigma-54-dependent transcriptional regulator n=1 Tax=Pseudoflavitalea sp. G-6-1-2 TaxID=2728841 RepID=UPI00146C61D2|nr:sigma-54 dependent transcriptional regulator [Pseudoflavitalea sp. G-6-1-2]NML20237.1 sigma-54-dependent Fis family transcriptional regulator [Pseudoflavitalea sp. G-6-1-2]
MKNQNALRIFILEDDLWYGSMLQHYLSLNPDYEVKRFDKPGDLFNHLHEAPDVITLDYFMPDMDGSEVLKKIREINPDINVVIISGQEDLRTAVSLVTGGAFDYIVKDEDTKDRLWNVLLHLKEIVGLKKKIAALEEEVGRRNDYSRFLIGRSECMEKVFAMIGKASGTNITVSVTGETGTGKEMVAKAIHSNSDRSKKPFITVNMAAIPRELVESELFGHEKGSFTGAVTRRIGKFEEANNGTLFLDEIGELEVSLQAKLLRALQEREITRVGSNDVIPINVRIIVATNRDLLEEVHKKNFREDLYYRLIGLPIKMPPLRDRGNDILILAKSFLDQFCDNNSLPRKVLSPESARKLTQYEFPGNVRELRSIMELTAVMSDGDTVQPDHIMINTPPAAVHAMNGKERTLREYEVQIIQHFLDRYDKDVLLVARKLGMGKSTIYRMIQSGELRTK